MLEEERRYGLLVMDEVDKTEDRRFVRRMERYFTKTAPGQYRTSWIVPSPFFVASDMNYAVQAADVCIYCVNWGFRLDTIGMNAPSRPEIAQLFGPWLSRLQFHGQGYRDGNAFESFGIVYVPDPYGARWRAKKRQRRRSHPKVAPRPSLQVKYRRRSGRSQGLRPPKGDKNGRNGRQAVGNTDACELWQVPLWWQVEA